MIRGRGHVTHNNDLLFRYLLLEAALLSRAENKDSECLVRGEKGWDKTEETSTGKEMEINRPQVNTAYHTGWLKEIYSSMDSFCLPLQKRVEERMSQSHDPIKL